MLLSLGHWHMQMSILIDIQGGFDIPDLADSMVKIQSLPFHAAQLAIAARVAQLTHLLFHLKQRPTRM
jgi:hypothetical protein